MLFACSTWIDSQIWDDLLYCKGRAVQKSLDEKHDVDRTSEPSPGHGWRSSSIQLDTAQVSFLKYWLKLKSQRDRGVLEKKYD